MAIIVPADGAIISASIFGKPVADEVNRLSAWQLANPKVAWGRVGHALHTVSQVNISAVVDLTGLSVTFNAVAGRYYKVTLSGLTMFGSTPGTTDLVITDSSNNLLGKGNGDQAGTWVQFPIVISQPLQFATGSKTVKARASFGPSGVVNTGNDAVAPGILLVEDIGPST